MAFIASKYTGGIDVNQVDRLAPLFSGGGTATAPDVDFASVSGAKLAAEQYNKRGYELAYAYKAAEEGVKNGTDGALQLYYNIGQEIAKHEALKVAVVHTGEQIKQAQESKYGDKRYIGEDTPGTVDAAYQYMKGNKRAFHYETPKSLIQHFKETADNTDLIDPSGNAINLEILPMLRPDYKGIQAFSDDYFSKIKGYTTRTEGGSGPGKEGTKGEEFIFDNLQTNSGNYVHLLNSQTDYVEKIWNDPGMREEAKSDAYTKLIRNWANGQGFTLPTAIQSSTSQTTGDRRFSEVYNMLEATSKKDGSVIQVAEVYKSGDSYPTYYLLTKDEKGKQNFGEQINDLNGYNFSYLREPLYSSKQENFMITYSLLDLDDKRDFEGIAELLHNELCDYDEAFKITYGDFKSMDSFGTNDEYAESRNALFSYARSQFHLLLDKAALADIRKSHETAIEINKKLEIIISNKVKDRTTTEKTGSHYAFDAIVDQLADAGILDAATQIGYTANYDGHILVTNLSPTSQVKIYDPILTKTLDINNAAGGLWVRQGILNYKDQGANTNIHSLFSGQQNFFMTGSTEGKNFLIPIQASLAKGFIIGYSGEILQTNELRNGDWYRDHGDQGDPSQTDLSGREISGSTTPYRQYTAAISMEDFLNTPITISKEEYVELFRTLRKDRKVKVRYTIDGKEKSHSEDISEVTDQKKALAAIREGGFERPTIGYQSKQGTKYLTEWMYANQTALKYESEKIYEKHGYKKDIQPGYGTATSYGADTRYENLSPAAKADIDILHQRYLKRYNDAVDEQISNNLNAKFDMEGDDGSMYARIPLRELYERDKDVIAHLGYNEETNRRGIQVVDRTQSNTGSDRGKKAKLLNKTNDFWGNTEDIYVILDFFNEIPLSSFSPEALGKAQDKFNERIRQNQNNQPSSTAPVGGVL